MPVFYGSWGELREKTQLQAIRWFVDNKIPIDVFWIDAGWYGDKPFQEGSTDANSEWWKYTGSWRPNKITYPRGLKPIGEKLPATTWDSCFGSKRSGSSAAPISSGNIPSGCSVPKATTSS